MEAFNYHVHDVLLQTLEMIERKGFLIQNQAFLLGQLIVDFNLERGNSVSFHYTCNP